MNPPTNLFHCDRGAVILPPKPQQTPEGFLRCYLRIAKVGELSYRNDHDGSQRIEVVSPEVLFSKKSIDSFKMKPLTYPHPPSKVDSANSMQYSRGLLGHYAVVDGDFLGFVGTVLDKTAVDALLSGEAREASSGYDTPIALRADGKFEQLDRQGNHVSIVRAGRAGAGARFHVDDAGEPCWQQEAIGLEDYLTRTDTLEEVLRDIEPRLYWEIRSDTWNEANVVRDKNGKFAGGSGGGGGGGGGSRGGGGGGGGGGGSTLLESAKGAARAAVSQATAAAARVAAEGNLETALATGGALAAGALANKVLNRNSADQIAASRGALKGQGTFKEKAAEAVNKFVNNLPATVEKVAITQGVALGTRVALTHVGVDPHLAQAVGSVVGSAAQPLISKGVRKLAGAGRSDSVGELSQQNAQTQPLSIKEVETMPRNLEIAGELFSFEDDAVVNAIMRMKEQMAPPAPPALPTEVAALGYKDHAEAVAGLKSKLDAAEGKLAGVQARVDELEAQASTRLDADTIAQEVKARADAWDLVEPLLKDDPNFKRDNSLDEAGIHKLAIAKKMPDLKLDGKSPEFINGVWETIKPSLEKAEARTDSSDPLHLLVNEAQRLDAADTSTPSPKGKSKRMERSAQPVA